MGDERAVRVNHLVVPRRDDLAVHRLRRVPGRRDVRVGQGHDHQRVARRHPPQRVRPGEVPAQVDGSVTNVGEDRERRRLEPVGPVDDEVGERRLSIMSRTTSRSSSANAVGRYMWRSVRVIRVAGHSPSSGSRKVPEPVGSRLIPVAGSDVDRAGRRRDHERSLAHRNSRRGPCPDALPRRSRRRQGARPPGPRPERRSVPPSTTRSCGRRTRSGPTSPRSSWRPTSSTT